MIKSRFDDLVKTLKTHDPSKGALDNAVTEASKLLEINYTMRQVDQELELCKLAIIETLKGHEAAALTLSRLEVEREKIAVSHDKLSDFADNARPEMIKIEEARNAFLALLDDDEDERELDTQNTRELREAVREVNNKRDDVLADLETAGQSIESLETELNDITTCITLKKTENGALRATLEQKRKDIINCYRKSLARHDELLNSKNRNKGGCGIKVEEGETFCG